MEYLKKDSAKANRFRRQFENTPTRSLTDCYRKPSHTKKQIWNTLSLECTMKCGFSLKVLSYNTFHFTVAFVYPDPETGVCLIQVDTPTHDYCFEW